MTIIKYYPGDELGNYQQKMGKDKFPLLCGNRELVIPFYTDGLVYSVAARILGQDQGVSTLIKHEIGYIVHDGLGLNM